KIVNIIENSGVSGFSTDKYFSYNVFLSLYIQGLIDLVWRDAGIFWCANNSILVDNISNDIYGSDLFEGQKYQVSISSGGIPISFRNKEKTKFKAADLDRVCSLSDVCDKVLLEEGYSSISDA